MSKVNLSQEKVGLDLNELGIIQKSQWVPTTVALFGWLTWQKNKGKEKHFMLSVVSLDVWY